MQVDDRRISMTQLDSRHEELSVELPKHAPKAAVLRLLAHLGELPGLEAAPQLLYYYVDTVARIAALILEPSPISSHLAFLSDLIKILRSQPAPVRDRVPLLPVALQRLQVLRAMEFAVRGEWASAWDDVPGENRDSTKAQNLDALRETLAAASRAHDLLWPYHLVSPEQSLPRGGVLTVLVDGDGVPPSYREAYVAILRADIAIRRCASPEPPVVRTVGARGEELVVGESLRALVVEAAERTVAFLGPQVQARMRNRQAEVIVTLRRPSPVTEVTGRSIMLPLVVALAHSLGDQLNLSAVVRPDPGVVWTGDVDEHGSTVSVSCIEEKVDRVVHSRANGFGYPAGQQAQVEALVQPAGSGRMLARLPLINLLDLVRRSSGVTIQSRSLAVRTATAVRRRARPLGIAGIAALSLVILALGIGLPRIASWLDTDVAVAAFNEARDRIEVFNSRGRSLRDFPILKTSVKRPIALDVDADGESEVFYGTGARDSVPGTLFCVDGNGDERWRFTGGFRDDQPRPFELTNTFNASGPFVRDLDHDGFSEVLAVFNHAPYYAGQLALLTVDGTYVSSFWNRGHFFAASLGSDLRAMAFADIDHDGLDEILAGGSNNGTNTAVLAILDPRAVRGVGPRSLADTLNAAWQSYIVFPACPPLEQTAGTIARLGIGTVQSVRWEGQPVIRAESKGWLPDTSWVGFTYHLDYDLQLVFFNMDDQTKKWIRRARAQGLTDADVDSPEFWRMMTDIRVIPGDPRLLLPPGEPGARDAAVATRRDGTQRGGAIP